MSFKEMIANDLDVFLNELEFAEPHLLGNKEIMMVVEEETVDPKKGLTDAHEDAAMGIFEGSVTIYLKSSDFKKPSVGDRIKLDNKLYYVKHASESDGMLKIVLTSNES